MLRRVTNNKAQSILGEYVLTFFLIIAVMTAMSLYFKRALQGRIRDAKTGMGNIVLSRAGGSYVGNFFIEYEPYYLNTVATVNRTITSTDRVLPSPGFSSGIFNKMFDERTRTETRSETTPPQLSD